MSMLLLKRTPQLSLTQVTQIGSVGFFSRDPTLSVLLMFSSADQTSSPTSLLSGTPNLPSVNWAAEMIWMILFLKLWKTFNYIYLRIPLTFPLCKYGVAHPVRSRLERQKLIWNISSYISQTQPNYTQETIWCVCCYITFLFMIKWYIDTFPEVSNNALHCSCISYLILKRFIFEEILKPSTGQYFLAQIEGTYSGKPFDRTML